ncbi:MAG: hypothetical protein H0V82_05310 [Candidatus Protochlamydia sp.]|nr:hypothetical protein [Candidatus Protochlamydia sp.]
MGIALCVLAGVLGLTVYVRHCFLKERVERPNLRQEELEEIENHENREEPLPELHEDPVPPSNHRPHRFSNELDFSAYSLSEDLIETLAVLLAGQLKDLVIIMDKGLTFKNL